MKIKLETKDGKLLNASADGYDNVRMIVADDNATYIWHSNAKHPFTITYDYVDLMSIMPSRKEDASANDVEEEHMETAENVDISTENGDLNLSAEYVNEYAKPEREDASEAIDEALEFGNSKMVNIEEHMRYSKLYAVPINFDERLNKQTPWLDLLIAVMRRVTGQNNLVMNFIRNVDEELDVLDIKYDVDSIYKGCISCKSITFLVSDFNTKMPYTFVFKLMSKGFNEGMLTVYMKDRKTLEHCEPTILKYIQDMIRWHDDFREKDCAGILDEELLKLDSEIRSEEHAYYLTHGIPKELLVYKY